MTTIDEIRRALSKVEDPELHQDLVSLGMVKDIQTDGKKISVTIELTTPACPLRSQIQKECETALRQLLGVNEVEVKMSARTRGLRNTAPSTGDLLPDVQNIILVASGKGGVGKSTVAINLAAGLAQRGATTGLLDADIYGPSIPIMMGVTQAPEIIHSEGKNKMIPVPAYGVGLMSIGFFIDPGKAVIWRGPLLHKALEQFLSDVAWSKMDYLVVDVPPGTGDVLISLSQLVRPSGAVLVTTPQSVALADVVRGQSMLQQVHIPVVGIVENMSTFICDKCGKEHDIFSRGGGKKAAYDLKVPFLGEVPLIAKIRESCDEGQPVILSQPEGPAAKAFNQIIDKLVEEIAQRAVKAEQAK